MNSPQDEANGVILPFPQRFRPAERPDPPSTQADEDIVTMSGPGDNQDEAQDRVLAIESVLHGPGREPGTLHHLRALPLGVSSGAFFPHTPTEKVPEVAQRLGVADLELMLQTAGEYQPEFAATLRRAATDAGTAVHSVHTMHHLHRMLVPYERRRLEERELFRKAIDLAATVGAKVLVWHGADATMLRTPDDWERFVHLAAELAAECATAGVILGVENVSWCALATVRDVARFATRLQDIGDADRIGFVYDPFQAVEAGANPFMLLAAMGNRVVNVHISDLREDDPATRHLPPGDGDLPWSALIRAIAGSGYQGPLIIEGPLGTDDRTMTRIRQTFDPLFRSVFTVPEGGPPDEAWLPESVPPAGVRKGIDLFNARKFYEQHEEIEHEWHAERGPLRRLYQGLLQIGVGFHHALHGNHKGAVLLLGQGIEKVSEFTPQVLGIETGRLVAESQVALERIEALGEADIAAFEPDLIPRIHTIW